MAACPVRFPEPEQEADAEVCADAAADVSATVMYDSNLPNDPAHVADAELCLHTQQLFHYSNHLPIVQLGQQQLVWVKHLSSGSFGEVHELRDSSDDIHYAWKIVDMVSARNLLRQRASTLDPDNEIHILGELAHPNIIKLLRAWVFNVVFFLLMEMCTEDLLHRLQRDGPMGRVTGRCYMVQLLEALAYLQQHRIAHRDVKLENLLAAVSPIMPDVLKLCDFGFARKCSRLVGCTTFIGSADYLAPEVRPCSEGRTYGFACDIWSCGVVAYALLTALPPYEDDTNTWTRSQGCFMPDWRLVEGSDPTPESFIRSCMVVDSHQRKPPRALTDLLWQ